MYVRTISLSASTVKDRSQDQWRTGQISHKQWTNFLFWISLVLKQQVEKPNPAHPWNICDSDNVQLKKRHSWNVNGNDGDEIIGLNLLLPPQQGGRHKNGKKGKKNMFMFLSCWRKNNSVLFFQEVSLTGNSDSLVSDGWGVTQHTAPRASFTCHTRNFSRVHVAHVLEPSSGQDLWTVVLASLQSRSISFMFQLHLAWRTVVSALLYNVSYTCTSFVHLSFVVISLDVSIHCHSARWIMLWPTGWSIPSHRLWAQVSHRCQQRTHSNKLTFEKGQSRHEPWRSRNHCGCVWSLRHNGRGTVDFTIVFSGARSEC